MMQKIITTEQEMRDLAFEIGKNLKGGEVIALEGDLGAGKTTFTKYLAEFFGIEKDITSPTFVLMKEYAVSDSSHIKSVVHVDAYRLETPEELLELGLGEAMGDPETVTVIEWADKLQELLSEKKNIIWITIALEGEKRIISIDE